MAMASMLIVAGAGARRFKNPSRILRTIKTLPRASRAMSTRTSPAPAPRLFKTASPPVSRIGLSLAHRRFSIELPASKPAPLAEYEGPLARTFTRLKLFSLGSLALASTLTPVLLLAPGEISMAGRVGLAITALATSGVSTALIAWIGQPYAGRMRLLESSSQPKLEIDTVSWKLQPRITTIHEPSFIRATSRPFATWELTNTPPLISNETAITKIVAETMDVKTGKSVGQWIVKYDPSAKTKVNGEWKVAGKCEMVGQPQRYFNVHEELLDDSWRVLG